MATLAELRAEAKRQKRKGYSKLKKAELEKLLDTPPPKPPRGVPRKKPEPAKKAPAKKAPVKKAPVKKMSVKEIVDKIDEMGLGEHQDWFYPDIVDMFIDGKGSEEKQLDRASKKAGAYTKRKIREAVKKDKIKSVNEFYDKFKTRKQIADLLFD